MNENLKTRIITALVGVPVVLLLLIYGGMPGVTFFAWVISMGMHYEFAQFTFTLPDKKSKTIFALCFNTLVYAVHLGLSSGLSHAFLGLVPVLFFMTVFLLRVPSLKVLTQGQDEVSILKQHVHELMALCFGFVYCTWLPLLLIKVREHQNGVYWLLLTLVTVWATDTGAYFAGKYFGKRKLFPAVSPKKTWEGAVGGTLLAVIVGALYSRVFLPTTNLIDLVIILTIMSMFSQIGDLSESLLKRAANIKDSGGLIPGHGGFMDRFDGVLFALPVMVAYLWIFSGF